MIVLEARDRVGGRMLNHDIGDGKVTELGAQFVGPTQDHILALAKAVGVDTFKAYDTGDNVYYKSGQRSTFSDKLPTGAVPLDPLILPDILKAVAQLDQMSTVGAGGRPLACRQGRRVGQPDPLELVQGQPDQPAGGRRGVSGGGVDLRRRDA